MALILDLTEKRINLVLPIDSSVRAKDDETYTKYLETLDETLLDLDGEPTRFVLKVTLDQDDKSKLMSRHIRLKSDGRQDMDINYMYDTVRLSLIDIIAPASQPEDQKLKFFKDRDGLVSKKIIGRLDDFKQIPYFFVAVQKHSTTGNDINLLKKS